MKDELGLTISAGVSFNKVFAKLGSDMKKPDATTVITRQDYRDKVWALPVSDLLYVGPATEKKLVRYGIHTIGDLANANASFLHGILGKNGVMLRSFANGNDASQVSPYTNYYFVCNTDNKLKVTYTIYSDTGRSTQMKVGLYDIDQRRAVVQLWMVLLRALILSTSIKHTATL